MTMTSVSPTGVSPTVTPANTTVAKFMNFKFGPGSGLNAYNIVQGTATGTISATVDTTANTITVNGSFAGVTDPATVAAMPQTTTAEITAYNAALSANNAAAAETTTAINNALNSANIAQTVDVTPTTGLTTAALVTIGAPSPTGTPGTPVESISTSGVIDFVDGSKTINAYDTNLKTLRIPDTVYDSATGKDVKVTSFAIGKDGTITATLADRRIAAIGQIAMASFKNPAGLEKQGNNLLAMSVNSGSATLKSGVGTLGEDNSGGYGEINQGTLEMSNVDLAKQFSDMIVASRAFQANGKSITTGDQILQDIINLKQ